MDEEKRERERKFIREKIVPRKKYKKVLGIIGAVVGAAILFGASAGAVFYLMQEVLKKNEVAESPVETIIIARDDVTLSPGSSETPEETPKATEQTTEKPSTEKPTGKTAESSPEEMSGSTADTAEASDESTGETPVESGSENDTESGSEGNSGSTPEEDTKSGSESETEESESTKAADETESTENASLSETETESPVKELSERAFEIRRAVALITVRETGATDWFSAAIQQKRELYGVIIAETSEYVLILTRAFGLDAPGTTLTIQVDGISCAAEFQKGDGISGLAVLRAQKAALLGRYEVISLGNSLTVSIADRVWFSGFSQNAGSGLNEGFISYVEQYRPTVDGYVQKISTGMLHYPGEQGILLNDNNELIGIVSDESCTEGAILTAWGISPMKYLLEDMCSGAGTAYLGIRCVDVSSDEGDALGIPAGLYIQEVSQDSPAYDAGLLPGDRIVRVDAGSVNTNHMLLLWMDVVEPGKEIIISIERRGPEGYEPLEIPVTPGERR